MCHKANIIGWCLVEDVFAAPPDLEKQDYSLDASTNLSVPSSVLPADHTTLIPNESEAFALEPIDITTIGECIFGIGILPLKLR